MKTRASSSHRLTRFWATACLFALFLLQPQDTSEGRSIDHRFARFDTRLAGAIKIAFWLGIAVGFWVAFPLLSALLMHKV